MNPGAPEQPPMPQNPYARGNSFQRPQQGAQPMPAQPITTPDPIIPVSSAPQPKRSKLPLFAAIGAVAVIGLIVLIVILSSIKSTEQLFNMYANYLTTGEATDKDFPAVGFYDDYYLDKMLAEDTSKEELKTYIAEADRLWNNFKKKFDKSKYADAETYARLNRDIEMSEEALAFLKKYAEAEILTWEDLYNLYIENGAQAATSRVEQSYDSIYDDTGARYGLFYAEYKIERDKADIELLEIYDQHGCIDDNTLSQTCIDNIDSAEYREAIERYESANFSLSIIFKQLSDNTLGKRFAIQNVLKYGLQEEPEDE